MSDEKDPIPWYIITGQVVIGIFALGGATMHAFPLHANPKITEDLPAFDLVDIAWLALAAVAVLLPQISEITVGGTSVKLRSLKKEAEEVSDELLDAIEDFANLAQNWSTSVMLYISLLADAKDDVRRELLLSNYIRDRMGEAAGFLSDDPDDEVRIMLWIYNPDTEMIEFFFSNEGKPSQQAYSPGEGMIGQAFLERRRYNEADVRTCPAYKKTRDGEPPYRAVLCRPIKIGDDTIGMLTADKKEAELFSNEADEIAKGLSAQCAFAIDQFRRVG